MLRNLSLISFISILCLSLTHCYRMPVSQGNYITQHESNQIKKGMTPDQVVATLGNPVLENTYTDQEMTYVYTYKQGWSPMKQRHLVIDFHNDHVTNVLFHSSPAK